MRLDYVSIFPAYFDALSLSLPDKAAASGLLDVRVHDLRGWAHDRHRTVDDSPFGGGAGMVMTPEPWGSALDAVLPDGATLVVPTPAGERLTQARARDLATRTHLVFACGRYEGIDQRVLDDAATRAEVLEVSLGDFVLNGGEVAALAVTEAVVRLLPGFVGNAESLVEESHEAGLLEHPVYTRPATWRGREVPAVLTSGDHAAIARWRHEESLRRTAARRPDLLAASALAGLGAGGDVDGVDGVDGVVVRPAVPADAAEMFVLQRACWVAEQHENPGVRIPPLHETPAELAARLLVDTVLVARLAGSGDGEGRLVGGVRAGPDDADPATWDIGRLMVAPDLEGRGLGRRLLALAEAAAPPGVTRYALFTGAHSHRNQRMYRKAGYRLTAPDATPATPPGAVHMTKPRRTGS